MSRGSRAVPRPAGLELCTPRLAGPVSGGVPPGPRIRGDAGLARVRMPQARDEALYTCELPSVGLLRRLIRHPTQAAAQPRESARPGQISAVLPGARPSGAPLIHVFFH